MRTFIALNLSPERRDALHAAAESLRETLGRGVSWVQPANLHLTLKFLGDRPDDVPARLAARLAPALRRLHPLVLAIGGVGAFPSLQRIIPVAMLSMIEGMPTS